MTADDWRQQANCLGTAVNLFFPEQGASTHDAVWAKAICAACPVRTECLDANIDEKWGIWGGMSERERRKERRRRAGFAEENEPPAQPRKRIRSAPMQPCGTRAAFRRHYLAGETPCGPCREANAEYQRAYRSEYRRNKEANS